MKSAFQGGNTTWLSRLSKAGGIRLRLKGFGFDGGDALACIAVKIASHEEHSWPAEVSVRSCWDLRGFLGISESM